MVGTNVSVGALARVAVAVGVMVGVAKGVSASPGKSDSIWVDSADWQPLNSRTAVKIVIAKDLILIIRIIPFNDACPWPYAMLNSTHKLILNQKRQLCRQPCAKPTWLFSLENVTRDIPASFTGQRQFLGALAWGHSRYCLFYYLADWCLQACSTPG
ncbi:MAG: hypothetical protein CVU45_09445 [Chloroflexi bacterium HGW-Chloroflexi-7]|nr:MAG: hypothetical protein CVU45_09445 [Chloroflexi bacterium HGW-Chloroflexi-7]